MEYTKQDATKICAQLLRRGYMEKKLLPMLELDENLLREVQDRLAQIGMELVLNAYSPFYAVKLASDIQEHIEETNSMGLKNNEVAMLVILWSKLILPKRLARQSQMENLVAQNGEQKEEEQKDQEKVENLEPQSPDDSSSIQKDEQTEIKVVKEIIKDQNKRQDKLFVRLNELIAEFGKHFGSKTALKSTLTRLSNLNFIHVHNEIISEGILLDLLIDGHKMANEIKRSALAYKIAGLEEEEDDDEYYEEEEYEEEDFED
mgnify:CR=1 FL=1